MSDADRLWTTTNTGEAVSDVLSPLCVSFWLHWTELAVRRGWYQLGLLRYREIATSADQNQNIVGCFFGRLAVNVDLFRGILGRISRSYADEFERDLFGAVRDNAPPTRTTLRAAMAMLVLK